jgi:hypothetical protein
MSVFHSSIPTVLFFFPNVKRKESVFCRSENICCCVVLRSATYWISWGVGKYSTVKTLRIRFYFSYEEAIWYRTGPVAIKSFVYCHGCLWRLYHPDFNFNRQLEDQAPNTTDTSHLYNTLELLMMGIKVPETCWAGNKICNKNSSVASSWHFISTF